MYILVGGSVGGGGGSSSTEAQEFSSPAGGTIVGLRNGANKVYTLSNSPGSAAALSLYINGILIPNNLYTLLGAVVTLGAGVPAPTVGQDIVAKYTY